MAKFEMTDDGLSYSYYGVADVIPVEYASYDKIDIYLDSDWFQEVVTNSFKHIDTFKESDCDRFASKISIVTVWLKEKLINYEIKVKNDTRWSEMPLDEMRKHKIYKMLTENPDWFKAADGMRFRSRKELEYLINDYLRKPNPTKNQDLVNDIPYIILYSATLTAMVHDGVLERTRESEKDVFRYCLVLPINEDYINGY